jgi:hypothetical protein
VARSYERRAPNLGVRGQEEMIEYAILGTSHEIQSTSKLEKPLTDVIGKYAVRMVAEEYTLDTQSIACITANRLHIPYLQVDFFPHEWAEHDVDREMCMREKFLSGRDVRLSHADDVREGFWLERIRTSADRGPVLIICGYLHVDSLAQKVLSRGETVLEKCTFPQELLDRKPIILSADELGPYVNSLRDALA